MEYRYLGNSDLRVSAVGFGCWAIGGHKWGPVDEAEAKKAITEAAGRGVNFFDTADFYGFGRSEELLGETIGASDNVIIATKVGLRWNAKGKIFHDLSKDYMVKACEGSLRRLRREAVDLYQIHWPDPGTPLDEVLKTLDVLVRSGKIRYFGGCNFENGQLDTASRYPDFVSYQGKFNLFDRCAAKKILPFCEKNNIGFIAFEPLFKGMLTGKFKDKPEFPKGDHRKHRQRFTTKFDYYKEKVDKLSKIANDHGLGTAQLALAALLNNKGVTTVIPGIRNTAQLEENISAVYIDKELIGKLKPLIEEALND